MFLNHIIKYHHSFFTYLIGISWVQIQTRYFVFSKAWTFFSPALCSFPSIGRSFTNQFRKCLWASPGFWPTFLTMWQSTFSSLLWCWPIASSFRERWILKSAAPNEDFKNEKMRMIWYPSHFWHQPLHRHHYIESVRVIFESFACYW